MNIFTQITALTQPSPAICVWENEGGAPAPDDSRRQYGRRIEPDQTWTLYHVFSGVPVQLGSRQMTGLTRDEVTDRMIVHNERAVSIRAKRPLPNLTEHKLAEQS